jgi:hypothetical protein
MGQEKHFFSKYQYGSCMVVWVFVCRNFIKTYKSYKNHSRPNSKRFFGGVLQGW